MDLRHSSSFELRNFYFTTVWNLFSTIFIRSGKCITWSSVQVLPNQVRKKSFYTLKDIDLRESHAKLHKNRVKLWEEIEFKG